MKKSLIACTLLSTVFTAAPSFAGEAPAVSDNPAAERRQAWGAGIGAALGAVAGGPVGLIAGSAVGAFIGWSEGLQADLEDTRIALAEREQALAQMQQEAAVAATRGAGNLTTVAYAGAGAPPLQAEQDFSAKIAQALTAGVNLSVHFRTDSDALESHYVGQLHRLASLMTALPSLHVRLEGHADSRGTDAANLALSERRVQAVREVLVANGVAAERIVTSALGERQPLSAPGDREGYAFDRRVVVTLEHGQPDRHATAPFYMGADAASAGPAVGMK